MNNLITTDVKMTSLDIAEVTGKRHADVMRDVRKEIDELGENIGQRIFALTSYTDKSNRESPCYQFGKDGAMQLALKYDAKTRYNVIKYIDELENSKTQPPQMSQAEVIAMIAQQGVEQEKRLLAVEQKQDDIKEIFTINTHNWRNEVNNILNKIAFENGGKYQSVRQKSYNDLEIRARVDLQRRLNNMKDRAEHAGATKKEVINLNYLDVIERDEKLVEIYLTIIKEMAIKYGIERGVD